MAVAERDQLELGVATLEVPEMARRAKAVGREEVLMLDVEGVAEDPEKFQPSSALRGARKVAETGAEVEGQGRGRLEDQLPHCRAAREGEAITLEVGEATEEELQPL